MDYADSQERQKKGDSEASKDEGNKSSRSVLTQTDTDKLKKDEPAITPTLPVQVQPSGQNTDRLS